MLQTIRERAQGWIAWVIVILISVPFALWGIQSYLGESGEPVAATVNGVEIATRDLDRRVQNVQFELRDRLGSDSTLNDQHLRAEVLDALIQEVLLLNVTQDLGLRVSDQDLQMQVLAETAFHKDGRFDHDTYERILQLQGLTPALFEAQLRQQLTSSQLIRAIAGSEFITRAELAHYQRLAQQQRELVYARFRAADFPATTPPTDAAIAAFYDVNSARFQIPEQVKLDYLLLDASTLAANSVSTDEELRQRYAAASAQFTEPERRHISHLLLTLPKDADDATAAQVLSKINDIRARIQAGEAFAALAQQLSADPGSASAGGALGSVEKGMMVPAFEQAAFALPLNTVSEPVRTEFGYHLIVVTEITPAVTKPFEAVREQLQAEVTKQRAEAQFYDLGERLANLAYETPDSLEPAAATLGLTVQHSDWISRSDGSGILNQPKVLAAAFSEEVLTEGRNSELIEPERDALQAIVVRVVEHRPAALKPLAEVREAIIADLNAEAAGVATAAAATAALTKLREGADWATVLGTVKLEEPGLVARQADNVPAAVLDTAFTLPAPLANKVSADTAQLEAGDVALVRVLRVEDGAIAADVDLKTAPEAAQLLPGLARQTYAQMVRDMERRADIDRTPLRVVDEL
ncbi:peptidylprolyl isomerase [Chromatium okenii]|uniref:SurA N-terminal domain-containing protein n=1 Tax=Chromatium okenii TaxID=61644 RepID=UPI001907FBFB|nr:SurA N-terminal domain-containing protein [Chromatium okenii]MBK1641717.1 peptidylprolyl isomerase [Chromatium okenii]